MTTEAIMKTLAKTPMTTLHLQSAFASSTAKPQIESLLKRLERKGLVTQVNHTWTLTSAGYALIQTPEPRPWKPYEPPTYVRRKGSSTRHIPSRF
jgi:predicted transcriptional regulator